MSHSRTDDRRQVILSAALRLAADVGYLRVTRDAVALAAGCSPALVSHWLGTMPQMHRAIMGEAIRTRNLRVIAQGLAHGDRRARNAPLLLREAAAASLNAQ
jgi:AcrR family transcriptional regulator